jgi:PAS domain S-box-containing protein
VTAARLKQRELVGFWLAIGILTGVATLAYRNVDAAADTLGWVEHAHEVIEQIEEVSASYARASAARRAYVVAGDASQLVDAPDLDARLHRAVAALRASIVDNASQTRRLETFALLLDQRIVALDAAVERRRLTGSAAETADGLALTVRVRTVREEMESEENRLLAERDARTRHDLVRTRVAEVVGTLASIAILLVAFNRLRHEIARRRASEQALRSSEGFLDSIVENIPHMIFVKGAAALRFERINRAGETLLGVRRDALIGKNDFDFFPSEQAASFQARDHETLDAKVVVDIPEEPIDTKDGERWLHTKKVPILDERGAPKFLLGISEDITERRKAAVALRTAKDAAEAANQELESFSYSVAHDLRAPLRAIDGFSSALQEDCADKLDAEGRRSLDRVRGAAQRMAELIDGLLGLSRLTRGDFVRESVDLTRVAQQSGERLRAAHPQREVELVVQDGLVADGDPRLLAAALDNLLANSWKFTSKAAHPRVEVGMKTEEGKPLFFVRDNGAGFEQAYAHKLFGAFQRLHAATEFEGSGIGLATVQRIVRRHGGRIRAEGEVGHGATFYFSL